MDSFFFSPAVLFTVSFVIICGCSCLFSYCKKNEGRFPTVNRSGPTHRRVNQSGPRVVRNTRVIYNEHRFNHEEHFGFTTNMTAPPFGSTDNYFNTIFNDTANIFNWNTTHTTVNDLPTDDTEINEILIESNHQSHQNEYCDSDFRSHEVNNDGDDSGGKCDIDRDESGDIIYDTYDNCGGTTYDSGGGDSGGGTCDSGGDTGGGDYGDGGDD